MRFDHYAELPDGDDETGIAVNKRKGSEPKHGSTHAELESE